MRRLIALSVLTMIAFSADAATKIRETRRLKTYSLQAQPTKNTNISVTIFLSYPQQARTTRAEPARRHR